MTDRPDLLSAKNISKRFYATQALDRVSFDLVRGEVHTLVGEKGGIIITGMNVVPPALAAVAKGEVEMTGMQPGGKNGPIARGEKVRASGALPEVAEIHAIPAPVIHPPSLRHRARGVG